MNKTLKKRYLLSLIIPLLSILPQASHAVSHNYIAKAPVVFEEKSYTGGNTEYSAWEKFGYPYDCSAWAPDTNTIELDVTFEQSQSCKQDLTRTVTTYVYDTTTKEIISSKVKSEKQTIVLSDTQDAIGTLNTSACLTRSELSTMISNGDDVTRVNTGCITEFSGLFAMNSTFNQDISRWDLSSAKNFSYMFYGATAFNQDISKWNVSNVTNMANMFWNATSFNGDIGNWNVSKVTNFSSMFQGATSFNKSINAWDVSSATSLTSMFQNADSFNQYIGDWVFGSSVSMNSMFLENDAFNQDIGNWNTSTVTNFDNMFVRTTAFNQDISGWTIQGSATGYSFYAYSVLDTENVPDKFKSQN